MVGAPGETTATASMPHIPKESVSSFGTVLIIINIPLYALFPAKENTRGQRSAPAKGEKAGKGKIERRVKRSPDSGGGVLHLVV